MPKFARQTFEAFESMFESFNRSRYSWGLPGMALGAGRFQLAAVEPGKVYVRILNEADQVVSLTTAVNLGANLDPAIKVRMEYIDGQLSIINPHPRDAVNAYGDKVSQAAVPPHSGAIGAGNDDYIDSQRFTPGLVTASSTAGVYVRIYAFRHADVSIPTQNFEIPSGDIPVTFGQTVLARINYDPITELFETVVGTPSYAATTDYNQDSISAITISPTSVPLAAITLYEGMTTTVAPLVRILDAREFLDPISGALSGYPDFGIQDTVTVVAGVLDISAALSRNIVVSGESGYSFDSVTQVIGLGDGQGAIFVAGTGDTITFEASSDINLYNGLDIPITGSELLFLIGRGSNVVTQPVDQKGGSGGVGDYILIEDQKSSTTGGGTFTLGAWRTRDLNTEVYDSGGHASVASNQITLAAGTYRLRAEAPGFYVGRHKVRWQDITNGVTIKVGTSAHSPQVGVDITQSVSVVACEFTIASPTVFELQHQSQLTQATFGFGVASGFTSTIEVYAIVELIKIA